MPMIDLDGGSRIKKFLKRNPRGMTISDLAKKMQINRNLIAKNLDLLVMSGQVEMQRVGPAKVYFLSQRVPVTSMLEFSSDLVIMIDREGKIIFVNEQVPLLLNIPKEALIGNRIIEINNPFFRDLCRKEVPDPNNQAGNQHMEERTILIGSGNRHFRIKKVPTTFEDGSLGFTFIIEDITRQKTYQRRLEIGKEQYRNLVMSSGEAIIGCTPEGRITSWNPAAEKLFGYEEAEIVGQPFSKLVPRQNNGDLDRILYDLPHGDCVQRHEMRMVRRDDTALEAKITIYPILNENRIITGTASIIQDITSEKHEMHARKYEERYRTLFEDMNIGVYRSTGDPRGRFVWGNTALLQILGYRSTEDLREVNVTAIYSEPDIRMLLLDELHKKGFVKNRVLSLKRSDDTPVRISVTALAEFNENQDLVFINGIVQDVSGFVDSGAEKDGQSIGNI